MPTSARTMSGRSALASIRSIASRPLLTETTRTCSSANVSSMTRRMVTLSSARSSVWAISDCFCYRPHVPVYVVDDVLHGASGQKNAFDAHFLQLRDVDVRDDAA